MRINRDVTTTQVAPTRSAREVAGEIGGGSYVAVCVVVGVGLFANWGDDYVPRSLRWATEAGQVVLHHLGWGFGIAITTMLGFYVLLAGGQLAGSPEEPRIRQVLGTLAQALFVAFVPGLFLSVVAACVQPALAGALLVVVPSAGVMFFLAVRVGTFAVFVTPDIRLEAARSARAWSARRLASLSLRSRRRAAAVLLANGIFAGAVGMLASIAAGADGRRAITWLLAHAIVAGVVTFAAWAVVVLMRAARDATSIVLAWIVLVALSISIVTIALGLWVRGESEGAVGMVAAILVVSLSSLWPRSRRWRFALDWSIQGAATRSAARSVVRIYARSVREIVESTRVTDAPRSTLSLLRHAVLGILRGLAPRSR